MRTPELTTNSVAKVAHPMIGGGGGGRGHSKGGALNMGEEELNKGGLTRLRPLGGGRDLLEN